MAAARCARAVIEYDGTAFTGSQRQPGSRTVQGELEEALNRLTGERIAIRLAGRTDAGVHATGQVAAFCLPPTRGGERYDWPELRRRLNAVLPPDLAVRSLRAAPPGFDPRREAIERVYRYRIRMGGAKRPLDRHRTLEIGERLDVEAMQAAAGLMLGERDFAALGADPAGRGRTVRRVSSVVVRRRGELLEVRVAADAFLRRMVRSLVALLLAVGRGEIRAADAARLLDRGERALAGRAAPARGLTLERVRYGARSDSRTSTTIETAGESRSREQET
ncbi:MAG TPA: tRNA pseudouridine(38-40) synthase TruA [Candidatus Limnocylindria bacterium]|nr:tRNA pseudouridine(38-40) synthase TruA [Candidatus Limnocylindria bacterium]